jgi:hypothetical protein
MRRTILTRALSAALVGSALLLTSAGACGTGGDDTDVPAVSDRQGGEDGEDAGDGGADQEGGDDGGEDGGDD